MSLQLASLVLLLGGWLAIGESKPPAATDSRRDATNDQKTASNVAKTDGSGQKQNQLDGSGSSHSEPEPKGEVEQLLSNSTEELLSEQARALDPTADGWDSEAASQATNAEYKKLAKWLTKTGGPKPLGTDINWSLKDFRCGALVAHPKRTGYVLRRCDSRRARS